MTYFEARQAAEVFRRYRELALDYWGKLLRDQSSPGGFKDGRDSRALRQRIMMLLPQAEHWADSLGVDVRGESHPASVVGGPVIPFNLLGCVTDQCVGHRHVSREDVLDAIDRCIGAADFAKRRLLGRLLKPWCWLIDVPALIVGLPFQVMRKAGVPDSFIEGTGAQIVKVILTTLLYLAGLAGVAEVLKPMLAP